MFAWLKQYQLTVVRRYPSLRVRVTERADEIREKIVQKELELVQARHDINCLREKRKFLQKWLAENSDDDSTTQDSVVPVDLGP